MFSKDSKKKRECKLHQIYHYEGPHTLVVFGWAAAGEVRTKQKNSIRTLLKEYHIHKISGFYNS